MHVHRLSPSDGEKAVHALRLLKSNAATSRPPAEQQRAAERFLSSPSNLFLLATEGNAPIGFAIAYLLDRAGEPDPMVLLYEIEVSPAHRRRGAARDMIRHLRKIGGGVHAVKMWTLTDEENAAACALYHDGGALHSKAARLFEWPRSAFGRVPDGPRPPAA